MTTDATEVKELTEGQDAETGDAGGTEAGAEVASVTETKSEATEGAFDAESLIKEVTGTETPIVSPERLPGRKIEEVEAETRQRQHRDYERIMSEGDRIIRQALKRDFDLDDATAANAWQQYIQPYLNALHANNESYNLETLDQAIIAALSEDEQKLYFERSYKIKDESGKVLPLSSRVEGFKGLLALGRRLADEAWQEKVTKGEYISREKVKKIAAAAETKGREQGERTQSSANSGQEVNGQTVSQPMTPEAREKMTSSEWLAKPKAERDRLRGWSLSD